jgi:hypothetical protein
MLGTAIGFRVLYGQNRHAFPATIGLVVPALYLFVALLLAGSCGFQGICIAYAVSWWLAFLALLVRIFGVPARQIWELASVPLRNMLVAMVVAAATVLAGQRLLLPPQQAAGSLALALRCLAVAGLGIASFAITGALLWPRLNVRQILTSRGLLYRSK